MIESNPSLASLLGVASDALAALSGHTAHWQAAAPGRVNLIGEHTDYNAGLALPMAIDRYTVAVAAPAGSAGVVRIRSLALGEEQVLSLDALDTPHQAMWVRYVQGVIRQYAQRDIVCPALDMVIASSVPPGGGLSSSAALELAVAHLLEAVTEHPLVSADRIRASVQAEREMAGVPCGVMDQTVVELAESGHALLLDCADHTTRSVPFDQQDVALLIMHSGVTHSLAEGAYAERRADCQRAAALLGAETLREVQRDHLKRLETEPLLYQRAQHVLTENDRVARAAGAIEGSQWQELGTLMTESHRSLRDDYEVSCHELDVLVDTALAEKGVYGARMTGGGFGGCAIALVDVARLEAVADAVSRRYAEHIGFAPSCYRARAEAGAREICAAL